MNSWTRRFLNSIALSAVNQKVTPDESIATLRKQRDEFKKQSEGYVAVFGEHPPEVIKPIMELLIERANGPITPELVTEVLSEFKQSKEEIDQLKTEREEQEKRVSQKCCPVFERKHRPRSLADLCELA